MRTAERDRRFEEFFKAESAPLQRFAALLVGDGHEAADLAQEALVRTYKHWGRIEGDPGPYARRIIVNLVRSAHRYKKVRLLRPAPLMAKEKSEGRGSEVEDWMQVADALKQLSPVRRATILLRFYEDMSEPQIAQLLDRPLGTVKSDIHRALGQLRPLLEDAQTRGIG